MVDLFPDAYATALLTMPLLPDREEFVRPYSVHEYVTLKKRVASSEIKTLGELRKRDIGDMVLKLGITSDEAYRLYILLNRGGEFSYVYEKMMLRQIEIVTICNNEYPKRVKDRLKDICPTYYYFYGNMELMEKPAVSILGLSGVRTSAELKTDIVEFVRKAVQNGYAVITGGEPGVSRIADDAVVACGGCLIHVLGGSLLETVQSDFAVSLNMQDRYAALSAEHPEALLTSSHAVTRNRLIFALSDAAVICNTDGRRAESEAIKSGYCKHIYALNHILCNEPLISRGAVPVSKLSEIDLKCSTERAEQLSMFDNLFEE